MNFHSSLLKLLIFKNIISVVLWVVIMGKHKEWRKIVKKMRRKRIRTKLAKIREALEKEEEEKKCLSPSYGARLAEETARREAAEEEERIQHEEAERRWEAEERRVREETSFRQAFLKGQKEAKEKRRLAAEEDKRKKEEAEKERQERMADYIYQFALGQRCSLPAEMLIPSETQPGKEACPFYNKVGACRFWDTCSRNHVRPALSDTLIFPGFYSHFAMSRIGQAEYDTDMSLEYDDKETYAHFLEFYRDIRYEFESCGRLTQLVVCSNSEPHLRGNVYVSYATEKETMAAYLKFHARYYGGKQLSCQFVTIPSWKSAVCGLHFKKKCPKGNNCNFLHAFVDPGPPFYQAEDRSSPDRWRWSLSPERGTNRQNDISENKGTRKTRKDNRRSRSREGRGNRSRENRRRSRSSERRRRSRSSERKRRRRSSERRGRSRSSERRGRSRSSERRGRSRSSERRGRSRSSERRGRSRSSERKIRSRSKEGSSGLRVSRNK